MVINETQRLSMGHVHGSAHEGLFARLVAWLGQLFCGLFHGHNSVLHFEGERMVLHCTSCGYTSPGWETSGARPRVKFAGDPRRHSLGTRPAIVPIRKAS